MSVGSMLRRNREQLGMTMTALSLRSGVARYLISRYEHGLSSPSVEQLDRLLEVFGREVTDRRRMSKSEQRSLDLSRIVAAELVDGDTDAVLRVAREQLERQRQVASVRQRPWLAVWDAVLDLPPRIIADLITDDGEFARTMRQSSPLTVAVSDAARQEVLSASS